MDRLVQKLHPALRPGRPVKLAASGTPLFSRQGDWDAGSTLHCVAMALALLGKLSSPATPDPAFWDGAWPHYLHGLTLSELVSFIWELNLGVRPVWSSTASTASTGPMSFCQRELARGWPVILGLRRSRPVQYHAALAVGVEGLQRGHIFSSRALLLLDPGEAEPGFAACNARLEFGKTKRATYVTATGEHAVTVEGAISIRLPEPRLSA